MDAASPRYVASWRIILAFFLDVLTVLAGGGYLIAVVTGQTTANGFQLQGDAALLAFGLILIYFIGARFVGGTLWQRILRSRRRPGESY